MANLANWIEKAAEGDEIEGVCIGHMGWGDFKSATVPQYSSQRKGVVLSWDEARPMLDYEFYAGFGAPGCNAVYVWTKANVMWITQYDGATGLDKMPRNPTDIMPDMPGG